MTPPIAQKAIATSEDGAALHADFPIRTEVAGIAAVIIPLDRYKDLLRTVPGKTFEEPLKALRALRPRHLKPLPSRVERDPEVAAFLRERFALADTIKEAHAACAEKFGAERTPSYERIRGFRTKVRRGA